MFGLEFLFPAALFALPLVGLPVLLHLLFRRKSPVVLFSTLRFIKASLQHTAARRRIQRWVLLSCRMLLLALLLWVIAQPARKLAADWAQTGRSAIAAIVVDTSYSMQLQQDEVTLLARADAITQDLLRSNLRDAKVAIFTSWPADGQTPRLKPAAEILTQWTPLQPQPAHGPLTQRVAAAIDLLRAQKADQKWLIVLSDLQSREFPSPLTGVGDSADAAATQRLVLFDLHPEEARTAGVTAVGIEPEQAIPGVRAAAVAEVAGRTGDSRGVAHSICKIDGTPVKQEPVRMASFDTTGRTLVRADLKEGLPAERFQLIRAALQGDDAMAWDNARVRLVETPPRQAAVVFDNPQFPDAVRAVKLALDPSEGKHAAWPVAVASGTELAKAQVAVVIASRWPDINQATSLREFARGGGTVVLMLQPGLEKSWASTTAGQKAGLLSLLPAQPLAIDPGGPYRTTVYSPDDRILTGLVDKAFELDKLRVERFVPLDRSADPNVAGLLSLTRQSPSAGTRSFGLLYRRTLGAGQVYTMTTVPETAYGNMKIHPLFLPLMVGATLRSASQSDVQNTEIGRPLALGGARFDGYKSLRVRTPDGQTIEVAATMGEKGRHFTFDRMGAPGIYQWTDGQRPLAMANVSLPAAESELVYRPAQTLAPADTIVARSLEQFQAALAKSSEREPRWTWAMILVLVLIGIEAALGSVSQLWRPLEIGRWFAAILGRKPA